MAGCRVGNVLSVLALRRPEFWERSRWHRLGRLGLLFAYCYLGVLIVLLFLENRLLFRPDKADEWWANPPAGLVVRDVDLTSADGTALHAWWAEPADWRAERGALLFSHGNGGNLSMCGEVVKQQCDRLGQAVLIYDYPGYGRSAGKPTEEGCYAAGVAAHAWLTEYKGLRAEDVILYGDSMGGAIATELATRYPCRALVLVSTFTSFPDMAQKTVPFLPARWLVRNKLDNLGKIGSVKAPVFIAHGTADRMIPYSQGERLFNAAGEPKQFFPMPGLDHNDTKPASFYEAVGAFLEEHALRKR
jgi:fermentation-respiration switch protein FrsA (DUF1100 family)